MERLKSKISPRRAKNTRLINEARSLLDAGCQDIAKLTGLQDLLVANHAEVSKISKELEAFLTAEEQDIEYQAAEEHHDRTLNMLAEIRCKIDFLERAAQNAPRSPAVNELVPFRQESAATTSGPRLPPLDVPIFRGELQLWTGFWEQFEQTIHNNNALTPTSKFYYLRRYVMGEAAAGIAGLPTTDACYADAIEILKQRYGNKRRIQQHHLSALRNLPPVKSSADIRGLRQLYDAVQLHIRCLNSLKVPTCSFSAMLVDILQHALPHDIVLNFTKEKRHRELTSSPEDGPPPANSSGELNPSPADEALPARSLAAAAEADDELKELLTFVRMELESREQCCELPQRQVAGNRPEKQRSCPFTASALHVADRKDRKEECFFCHS